MSTPQPSQPQEQERGPYLVHLDSLFSAMSSSRTIASRIARLSPAHFLYVLIHCHLGSKDGRNKGEKLRPRLIETQLSWAEAWRGFGQLSP